MNISNALIIVLQLWSIFFIIGTFFYMIYAAFWKNNQWQKQIDLWGINFISMAVAPLKYLFTKNDTSKKKTIVLGLFFFSIMIQIFILKYL